MLKCGTGDMYEPWIMELYKFHLDNAVRLNLCCSGDNCVLLERR